MMSGTTLKAEQCVQVCAQRAWKLACCLVWNTEDALDVVQQASLVAASKADQIPADDPWPWFARVVTLEGLKLRQSRARAARMGENLRSEAAMPTVDAALEAERRELQTKLREALAQLPEELRDALTLTHIAGLSVREAAAALGVSSSTVDRRVQQGLTGLRRRFDQKQVLISAALCGFGVDHPPQGSEHALQSWLSAVRGHGNPGAFITGGIFVAKQAVIAGVVVVVLAGLVGAFVFAAHPQMSPEQWHEWHHALWRSLHGK